MAAGSKRQYIAEFAIGAKLLSSFKSVMASAQVRMRKLHTASMSMARGILGFVGKIGGAIGLLGSFGLAKIFHEIFGEASAEAEEMHHRTIALTAAFLENHKIAKGGLPMAEEQIKLLRIHEEKLEKQGVLHRDILDAMATQIALRAGLPPGQIQDSLDVLQNILVVSKGANATQEEAVTLANAYSAAVTKGRTLALSKADVRVSKEWSKTFGTLVGDQARYNELMKHFGPLYAKANEQERNTPTGRIQLLANAIRTMAEDIGGKLLPARAELADLWRDALPEIGPLLVSGMKFLLWATKQLAIWVRTTLVPGFKDFKKNTAPGLMQQLGDAMKWVVQNADLLKPLLIGIAATMVALNVAAAINPFSLLIVGIAAAAFGVYELNQHLDDLRARKDFLGGVARGLQTFQTWLDPFVESFKKNFVQAWIDLAKNLQTFQNFIQPFVDWMKKYWVQMWLDAAEAIKKVIDLTKPARDAVKSVGGGIWEQIKGAAAFGAAPQAAGGIIRRPTFSMVGERGPEAIIPLGGGPRAQGLLNYANQAMGRGRGSGATNVTFAPNITINGNAGPAEQRALTANLRTLAKDFITQFKAAQQQERRLSFESGYS